MKIEAKEGDLITILERPHYWSNYFVENDGRNVVKYPFTAIIDKIKSVENEEPWINHISILAGGYGWNLEECKCKIEELYEIY